MSPPAKNYVFGPVHSRRIGRSLGVDLVPFKTCTYDCIEALMAEKQIETYRHEGAVFYRAIGHQEPS